MLYDSRVKVGEIKFFNKTGLLLNIVISPKGNCWEARLFTDAQEGRFVSQQYIRVAFRNWDEFKSLILKSDETISSMKEKENDKVTV